jgi:hypothetical protein
MNTNLLILVSCKSSLACRHCFMEPPWLNLVSKELIKLTSGTPNAVMLVGVHVLGRLSAYPVVSGIKNHIPMTNGSPEPA